MANKNLLFVKDTLEKEKCEICGKVNNKVLRCLPLVESELEKMLKEQDKVFLIVCKNCKDKVSSGKITLEQIKQKLKIK
jgi:hypothetical protein